MSVIAVLGSAFAEAKLGDRKLEPVPVATEFGDTLFHRYPRADGADAYILFRHGVPKSLLPNQVSYLANAVAMRQLRCEALLVTSSVCVLDPQVPVQAPLTVSDVWMPENRLPNGRLCTIFQDRYDRQGLLVLDEGLFSAALTEQMERVAVELQVPVQGRVVLAYAGGPRGKTRTENAYAQRAGAHAHSMTLAPEVVLANEMGIPVAGFVVGYRYTLADAALEATVPQGTPEQSAPLLERAAMGFLEYAQPVPFGNRLVAF